jgi:hypothetical protein
MQDSWLLKLELEIKLTKAQAMERAGTAAEGPKKVPYCRKEKKGSPN